MNVAEDIKSKLDIVDFIQEYLKLSKAGTSYRALCPFHKEKTPSFMVSKEKQIWHCFGCGKGGDHFTFYMEMESAGFREALDYLSQKAGVDLRKYSKSNSNWSPSLNKEAASYRERLFEMNQLAKDLYKWVLWNKKDLSENILKYLKDRGFKEETLKEYEIGYVPQGWQLLQGYLNKKKFTPNEIQKSGLVVVKSGTSRTYDRFRDRIMIPLKDVQGRVVGFSGRENPNISDDKKGAKYVNTVNTAVYNKSKYLYNLNEAKQEIKSNNLCLVLEGQFDVIASVQAGVASAVAPCGTALTIEHLNMIKRYTPNIIFCFDDDSAGVAATERSYVLSSVARGFTIKIIKLPKDQDPADVATKNPKQWQDLVHNAINIIDYLLKISLEKHDKKTVEGKRSIAEKIMPLLVRIENPIERAEYLDRLSSDLAVSVDILLESYTKQGSEGAFDYERQFAGDSSDEEVGDVIENKIDFLINKLVALYLLYFQKDIKRKERLDKLNLQNKKLAELVQYAMNDRKGTSDEEKIEYDLKLEQMKSYEVNMDTAENAAKEFDIIIQEAEQLLLNSKKQTIQRKIEEAESAGDLKTAEELLMQLSQLNIS